MNRKITGVRSQGHGQYSPSDVETGALVVNTVNIESPPEPAIVGLICDALAHGDKLPEIYRIDPKTLQEVPNAIPG